MKKQIAIALLSLVSASANAAGTYALTVVNTYNPFSPTGTSVLIGPAATGGSATVDGLGTVTAADVQFSFSARLVYEYSGGIWSGVVGGNSVTHTENCVEIAGLFCTGTLSGLAGIWNNTQQNGGGASNVCSASTFFAAGNCDQVSIAEVPGVSLTIIEQSEFSIPGLPFGNVYRFTAVPAPAGIWLLGTALGAIGWMRRKVNG